MFHFLKNFKMGQKVGGLYRTKNKEQGKEKYKIPDQLGPPGQTRLEWERGRSIEPGVGGVLADWLTGYTAYRVKESMCRDTKVI